MKGPVIAPMPTGTGMKVGKSTTSSMPPKARWRNSSSRSSKLTVSPAAVSPRRASRSLVRTGSAAELISSAVSRSGALSTLNRLDVVVAQRLDQQFIDPRAVQVDHFEAPAIPLEVLARVRDAAEARDHHAGDGVVIVILFGRQAAQRQQLAQIFGRHAAVDQEAAVVAPHHHRLV